jgi:hypothetical protein
MRLIGERRAVAAAVLAYFGILFGSLAYMGPPQLIAMFAGMGAAYAVAFVGVVALWFWARWFAIGLGFSGVVLAIIASFQLGEIMPALLFFGGAHAILCIALAGAGAASVYDGRKDWRERFRLDDNGVNRLGKAVTRAGASLPYLIMAGRAPKPGPEWVLGAIAIAGGVLGIRGLLRMRTWGLFALAGAGIAALGIQPAFVSGEVWVFPWMGTALCAAAIAPFVPAMVRQLRAR